MVRRIYGNITVGIANYYSYNVLFDGVATVINHKPVEAISFEASRMELLERMGVL
jgi:hypothetical protein